MPRRPRGDGSIYQRADGRWVGALVVEGRRYERYAETRDEVRRKLDVLKRDRDRGLPIVAETVKLGQFAEEWLETVQATLRPSTYERYRDLVRVHILPALGRVKLAQLTPTQVQQFYAQRMNAGMSTGTAHTLHAVLHRLLAAAMRLNLVQRNVSEMVDPPKRSEHEIRVLLPGEIRAFLAAAQGDRLEALYVLALATGMRMGELLALKWRDVDLEPDEQGRGSLQVRATLQWQEVGGYVFAPPKTRSSRRRIKVPTVARLALTEHHERQRAEREQLRDAWRDDDLVFPNTIGRPLDRSWLRQNSFYPLLQKASLRRMRFHDLRHTAATMMLLARVNPKVVSEVLGHASISITLDIYSHVLPDMQEDAAAAMEAILGERVLRQMAPQLLEGETGENNGRDN